MSMSVTKTALIGIATGLDLIPACLCKDKGIKAAVASLAMSISAVTGRFTVAQLSFVKEALC